MAGPESEPVAEPGAPPTRAAPPRVVILSDSQAIDRRGRLIDITGLAAVRIIGKTRSWIVPLDSVEGGTESVLLDLGGDGCDTNGEGGGGGGDGPHGGGGEQMLAGMQVLMFEGDTIDCCEGEYEEVIEGECQCPEYLIEDEELGCICENLQDPEDYCFSEGWEYRFEIDAPCTSCVETFYQSQFYAWACPIDCDEPGPGGGGSGGQPPDSSVHVDLVCDIVVRGEHGGCTLIVDPPEALDSIQQWTFESEFVNPVPDSSGDNPWQGKLVVSGQVRVNFTVNGEPDEEHFDLVVLPRTTGIWDPMHWDSVVKFYPDAGNTVCQSSGRIESVNDSVQIGWIQTLASAQTDTLCVPQRIEPQAQPPADSVTSGPNAGAYYFSTLPFHWKSASRVHPGAFPEAPVDTLVNAQQSQECPDSLRVAPDSNAVVNFWTFNNTCKGVQNWSAFIPGAKAHEQQHFQQARDTLMAESRNIYLRLDTIVRGSEWELQIEATETYEEIDEAARDGAKVEPTGNWSGTFWVWVSAVSNWFGYVSHSF